MKIKVSLRYDTSNGTLHENMYVYYNIHLNSSFLTYLLHGAESFVRSFLQLVKKFPAFHGTPRFITALTSVRHLSLSWASPIQSIYPHPTSLRSILILSTHLRLGLPSGLLPSGFPTHTLYTPLSSPTWILHRIKNVSVQRIWWIAKHSLYSVTFHRKSCRLWDYVQKYSRAGQATDDNMAHAHCALDT